MASPPPNLLRLWKAEATESFDFEAFNVGDYYGAVDEKVGLGNISKVLYPNDEPEVGKQLRLTQQYFFVSCSLQDMIRLHLMRGKRARRVRRVLGGAAERHAPGHRRRRADAAAGRRARDGLGPGVGDHAADCGYTNHTLLPEALEKWPLPLFGALLPRHLEIIYEINRRFLDEVRRAIPGDERWLRRLSLDRRDGRAVVRMAHLACVGSHAVNGVAALHTELLKQTVLRDFYEVDAGEVPQRDQRRHTAAMDGAEQPEAARADHQAHRRPLDLRPGARARSASSRSPTTRRSSGEWQARQGRQQASRSPLSSRIAPASTVDPESLFDIQVKRLHEYKRQHLNVLYLVTLYNRLKRTRGRRARRAR